MSKSSIKDLLNNLLDEPKGFKYQITLNVLLKKIQPKENKLLTVYFNSKTKKVINH